MQEQQLTDRQQEVLDFIIGHFNEHGVMPSYRELCDGIRCASPNSAFGFLRALERKGYITIGRNKARSIKLNGYRLQLVKKRA